MGLKTSNYDAKIFFVNFMDVSMDEYPRKQT